MADGQGKSGDPGRNERLKAALRDNLKRRKAQGKARAQAAGETRPAGKPAVKGNESSG